MADSAPVHQRVDDPLSPVKASTALYHPAVADAAYQLRYAWTGWPSRSYSFAPHSVWSDRWRRSNSWTRSSRNACPS
jgi:hypothetical protein